MSYRLNLPQLPDPKVIARVSGVLKRMGEYLARHEPLAARASSLQSERNKLHSKMLDLLLEHVEALERAGALEPLQTIISDLIENEMENMDLLVEMCENVIKLTSGGIGEITDGQKETNDF